MNREILKKELDLKRREKNFRKLKNFSDNMINLSSNDFLFLAHDEKIKNDFIKKYSERFSFSSSSSRLITGNYSVVRELEKRAEEIYKKPVLVMNSGFSANKTIIETFYNKNSLIITDRLNHASIYAGIISSSAKFIRYRHLDMVHLESILEKYRDEYEDILIVSESVYSMDGDSADLQELVRIKKKYGTALMIDEAHSFGVYGYGIAYNKNLVQDIDFLCIPLGKGGGSVGAYIVCDEDFKDYIINFGKEFIYSTALPPVNNLWNLYILNHMNDFSEKINKLENLKNYTLKLMKELEINTVSDSQIVSLITGDNEKTDIITENLRKKGWLVCGIKSPTVPKGLERIRISLHSELSKEIIKKFLEDFKNEWDNLF